MDTGTNQNRCVKGTCTNKTLRDSGCFMCSNEHGDEKCVSCIENYIDYYGQCVNCSETEDCPFNNTRKAYCTTKYDSHCGFGVIGCKNHQCNMGGIKITIGCAVTIVVLPPLVFLVVHLIKKLAYMGYIKLNQDPLFSDAFYDIELIEPLNPLVETEFESLFTTDYSW